jgi:hypothetical protein
MSLTQAGAASNTAVPLAVNWPGLSGYQRNSAADQTVSSVNAASKRQQLASDFGNNSTQVSLSDAARALAAFSGNGANSSGSSTSSSGSGGTDGTGSSDFDQEAQYLGGVADASLVAMGIITPDQQAGTQITFDSLSYNVSSSTSAGISQQNGQTIAQYGSEQQAQFVGQGHITTADGRTFDFQVEVDMDQSQQVEAATGGNLGSAQSGNNNAGFATNGVPSAVPPISENASSGIASPTTSSVGSINWDEILKDSKSLIDLLESIGKETQAANAAANNSANSSAGNATSAANSANAATGGSTPASPASGTTAASPANSSQDSSASANATQNPTQNPSQSAASLAA